VRAKKGGEGVGGGSRFAPDVYVKKGYSWSDQLGIVIAALVDAAQSGLVKWTRDVSFFVCVVLSFKLFIQGVFFLFLFFGVICLGRPCSFWVGRYFYI
jgi:hypothetical protein